MSACVAVLMNFRKVQPLPCCPGSILPQRPARENRLPTFTRSNAGWQATISLPEAAIQFGYRIGEDGEFVDAGTMPNIDQRTGKPMPVTWFALPPDQPAGTIYVTWRDKRGEEAGVFPINFDPNERCVLARNRYWSNYGQLG